MVESFLEGLTVITWWLATIALRFIGFALFCVGCAYLYRLMG